MKTCLALGLILSAALGASAQTIDNRFEKVPEGWEMFCRSETDTQRGPGYTLEAPSTRGRGGEIQLSLVFRHLSCVSQNGQFGWTPRPLGQIDQRAHVVDGKTVTVSSWMESLELVLVNEDPKLLAAAPLSAPEETLLFRFQLASALSPEQSERLVRDGKMSATWEIFMRGIEKYPVDGGAAQVAGVRAGRPFKLKLEFVNGPSGPLVQSMTLLKRGF